MKWPWPSCARNVWNSSACPGAAGKPQGQDALQRHDCKRYTVPLQCIQDVRDVQAAWNKGGYYRRAACRVRHLLRIDGFEESERDAVRPFLPHCMPRYVCRDERRSAHHAARKARDRSPVPDVPCAVQDADAAGTGVRVNRSEGSRGY